MVLQIVKKPEDQRGFAVLPRRWVVERTLSWISRCRRLSKDYERLPEHAEAMAKWSMIGLMTRARTVPTGSTGHSPLNWPPLGGWCLSRKRPDSPPYIGA